MSCCCIATVAIFGAVIGLIRLIVILITKWDRSPTCLIGKTAIVTGANTGIGYYTALDFAKRGARVILACRNKEKAEDARINIVDATGNQNVVVKIIDMKSFESVRKFAEDFNKTEERLDILVNNAGVMYCGNQKTEDGLQLLMQVNHFSTFLLTHLLIDKLKKSAPSRIITVSSTAAWFGKIDFNKPDTYPTDFFCEFHNYSNSKLANMLFTKELAKRLENSGVTANTLHPGIVQTDLHRDFTTIFYRFVTIVLAPFIRNSRLGAQTTIYAAVNKDISKANGQYFDNCQLSTMFKNAQDPVLAAKFWKKSEELVKLTAKERLK